jgi:hypothetical protein
MGNFKDKNTEGQTGGTYFLHLQKQMFETYYLYGAASILTVTRSLTI